MIRQRTITVSYQGIVHKNHKTIKTLIKYLDCTCVIYYPLEVGFSYCMLENRTKTIVRGFYVD